MELIFLGTSAMVPTETRNHTAMLLRFEGEGILFDCGEGTQRQFKQAKVSITTITKILISHWHGDHVFGLPGVIQSLGMSQYQGTIELFGPKGTKKHMRQMFQAFGIQPTIPITIHEVKNGVIFENDTFLIQAEELDHNIPCLGYAFIEKDVRKINLQAAKKHGIPEGPLMGKLQQNKSIHHAGKVITPGEVTYLRPGKKIAVILDTVPCSGALKLAQDADVLVCEATYTSALEEKGEDRGHMTARQAAQLAQHAHAKKLIITHFSARYTSFEQLEHDARELFPEAQCAYDFLKVKL